MNIYSKSFFGTYHSWAVTMRALMSSFAKNGNNLSIHSINGYENFNKELEEYKETFMPNIDLEICYTLPLNFKKRFNKKSKLKCAIYNYESSKLPKDWSKAWEHIDYILPSSEYSKNIFLENGYPEEKCIVIPHGIFLEDYNTDKTLPFLDKFDSFKFLNVSIPHYRKNIDVLIDAYYNCFSKKDNVSLILKTTFKKPEKYFECDVEKIIREKQFKYIHKELPHLIVIDEKLDSMIELYNSSDCIINCSSGEGFGLPLLESLALNKIIIAPDKGGQRDFLNHDNSILIDSKFINAPLEHQYWIPQDDSKIIQVDYNDLCSKMLNVYHYHKKIKARLNNDIVKSFSWDSATEKILKLT